MSCRLLLVFRWSVPEVKSLPTTLLTQPLTWVVALEVDGDTFSSIPVDFCLGDLLLSALAFIFDLSDESSDMVFTSTMLFDRLILGLRDGATGVLAGFCFTKYQFQSTIIY
jgi:hypothetical protein